MASVMFPCLLKDTSEQELPSQQGIDPNDPKYDEIRHMKSNSSGKDLIKRTSHQDADSSKIYEGKPRIVHILRTVGFHPHIVYLHD